VRGCQPDKHGNFIHPAPIHVPPLHEQHAIAALLGALDDKIGLNRRMAQTLEAMARALFKSWFVDFDPVRAKVEGRPTGLPDDLAALFPDRLDEDGLPAGWTRRPVGEIFEVSGGNTPSTANPAFWNGAHQWATPKDLSSLASPVLLETERRLSDTGLEQCSSGLLPPGSLLLSSRAPIGYMAFTVHPTAINQGFAGILKKNTSTAYAWAWCDANMDMITGNAGGLHVS
jgi:type I restriction enzyme S subunit